MKSLPITIRFLSDPNPGTEEHLHQIAENYLQGKGVKLVNGVIEI